VDLTIVTEIAQGAAGGEELGSKGLKALALGLGTGFGAIGPGVGVGYIFGKTIESVTRQPEMRGEIQSIMWLGFALTEAIVFYALMMSLVAFFIG
jgi:F-type H+-transporting ATPase subunit c